MSNSRDIADSAATINFIDGVTSNVQTQLNTLTTALDNISVTSGTLTKTFTNGETASISLTSNVLVPNVSVTKEVPQSGATNNTWDVNSTSQNYTRLNSAPATTLDWSGELANASYTQAFSVSSQDIYPSAVAFNADGTKMFIAGNQGDDIGEYTLSTGFDVSTASFVDSFSVNSQESAPMGLAFNTDGTRMFVNGESSNTVYQYALSTGFDVSTASYTQGFSTAAQDSASNGVTFNTDGTKMFVTGESTKKINEYTLSSAFDVSTASFVDGFLVSSQADQPKDTKFNSSGTEMYVVSRSPSTAVYKYTLTTGFDVSTASYANVSFSIANEETSPQGLAFSADSSKMYVCGFSGADVNEYSLPLLLSLGTGSFASADVGKTIEANSGAFVLTATDGSYVQTTAPTSYAQVASGSWSMYGVVYNTVDGDLELSGVSINGFDVSLSSFVDGFSVTTQETSPKGVAFNTDGTKMFVVGDAGVNEYTLSAGFDVSTSTYLQNFSVSAQESSPEDIAFNTDGTKMFILGSNGVEVNEYALSTGFNVSTAVYDSVFSVSGQDADPSGLAFSADGTYMFMSGNIGNSVYKYTLSTGFDVSTASYTNAYSVNAQESNPQGVAFNTDGTKMFVCGTVGDDVNEYTLSTAYDPATSATFVDSFSVSAQDGFPMGLTFNADGTKMFVIGAANKTVYQYSVGSLAAPTGYQPVHTTASTDTTYWTDINSMTADQAAGDGNVYYAISTDDRTTWTVIDNTDGERDIVRNNAGTWQYNSNGTYASETWVNGATNTELATLAEAMAEEVGYLISNASYDSVSFDASAQETSLYGLAFNSDGTAMYTLGYGNDTVYQYTLSTAYDITTASYASKSFSVASQDAVPLKVIFNTAGTKMYVLGSTNDSVFQYSLSTGFDVSTASYDSVSFSVASQETSPAGMVFNNDGTTMFIIGSASDAVYQYSLSTAFDLSTASYASISFSVSAQATSPTQVLFNSDGTKMFVLDNAAPDEIYQYSLSTAFNVSTASYDSVSFDVTAQTTFAGGMAFNGDGTKLLLASFNNGTVYQYSSTASQARTVNQMDKTQLDAVTDPNHIALGNDFDLSIILNMTSGTTVPSSNGVAINYDANILNKGAVLGTDYDFDAPAQNKVRITALAGNNLKVRVV